MGEWVLVRQNFRGTPESLPFLVSQVDQDTGNISGVLFTGTPAVQGLSRSATAFVDVQHSEEDHHRTWHWPEAQELEGTEEAGPDLQEAVATAVAEALAENPPVSLAEHRSLKGQVTKLLNRVKALEAAQAAQEAQDQAEPTPES